MVFFKPEEAYKLKKGVEYLVELVNNLGFSINGGKDSLSMNVKIGKTKLKVPTH